MANNVYVLPRRQLARAGISSVQCSHNKLWVVWRLVCFLYLTFVMSYSIHDDRQDDDAQWWMIYVTHWTLLVEICYFGTATLVAFKQHQWEYFAHSTPDEENTPVKAPLLVRINWTLMNVAYPATLAVFILYWTLVYDGGGVTYINTQVHGVNWILAAVDGFFTAHVFYLKHIWMVMVYGFVYVIWSIIHSVTDVKDSDGEDYIYSALNWNDIGVAAVYSVVVVLIGLPIMYTAMWGLWKVGNMMTHWADETASEDGSSDGGGRGGGCHNDNDVGSGGGGGGNRGGTATVVPSVGELQAVTGSGMVGAGGSGGSGTAINRREDDRGVDDDGDGSGGDMLQESLLETGAATPSQNVT